MSCLLITYDLNKPGQDYKELHETIKGLGDWWHHLDSTWLVDTSLTVDQVAERIVKVIDSSDRLLVVNISGDSYQGYLTEDAWQWIRKHI